MKTWLMATATLAWAGAVAAQKAPKDFYVGVRATGGSFFFVNSDDRRADSPVSPQWTGGGGGGISLGDFITPHFGFEAQALYLRQGQNYRIQNTSRDSSVSLTFLKVPLMFQYTTDRSRRVRFLARLGPQISFLTAATRTATGAAYSDVVIPPRLQFYDLFNTTDLSIAGDAGVDWVITDELSLQTTFRGEFGLVDAEDRTLKAPGRATTYLSGLQLQVGLSYTFNPLNVFSGERREKNREGKQKARAPKPDGEKPHVPVE
jgi:hypothetical protein